MKPWQKLMRKPSRKQYKKGGWVGPPPNQRAADSIAMCILTPGELIHHPDGTTFIVNEDHTCSPISTDHDALTRLAEYLHDQDHGETITEHEDWCQVRNCQVRELWLADAARIMNIITKGEPE